VSVNAYRDRLATPDIDKNGILMGQARWVKMISRGGKLTKITGHPKTVNKLE
jgi:hypothetical protein